MPVVDGSAQLAALAARLKVAGDVGIRREMMSSLRAAAKPLIPLARASALARLPKRGGLAERVATTGMGTSVRTTPATARVRVFARDVKSGAHDVRATNNGYVRHPVFNDRENWVRQEIPNAKGWWTDAMRGASPAAEVEVQTILRRIARQVNGTGI
jgi:hypothetical protein